MARERLGREHETGSPRLESAGTARSARLISLPMRGLIQHRTLRPTIWGGATKMSSPGSGVSRELIADL